MKLSLIKLAGGACIGGLVGCGGVVSGPAAGDGSPLDGGATTDGAVTDAGIDAADAALPPPPSTPVVPQTVTTLTKAEYANTVHDLLGVPPSEQTALRIDKAIAGGFAVGTSSTSELDAMAYHDSAVQIAAVVTSAANLASLLMPAGCSAPADDGATSGAACASAFVAELARRAYRHGPVDAPTLAALGMVYSSVSASSGFTAGIAAVVETILQSPSFLYHLETEEQALGVTAAPIEVTGYSMANRLSYFLWSSMPDAALFAAAAAGQLSTPAQVRAQATRMIADPKAKVGMQNFSSQWLGEQYFPTSKADGAGGPYAELFSPDGQQAIIASFERQVQDALWAPSGAMTALLTSTTAYANAAVAPVFGVSGVTGTALQPVQLDSTKRIGILSHPVLMALLATSNASHPIKRGRFIIEQVLCRPEPDPPPTMPPFEPPAPGESLRQDFERLTATGPDTGQMSANPTIPCGGCHARMDAPGFLFESFDTIGRWRQVDDYGQPVDLTNITIVGTGDPAVEGPTSSSVQFAKNLAASDLPNQCFTANLYRFMTHRDDTPADGPVEAWLDQVFDARGQSLPAALEASTQTDAFLKRVNAPTDGRTPVAGQPAPALRDSSHAVTALPPGTPVPTWTELYTLYFGNAQTGGCGSMPWTCHQSAHDYGAFGNPNPSGFVCGASAGDCYQGMLDATPPLVTPGSHPADPSTSPLIQSLYTGGRPWTTANNSPLTLGYAFTPYDLALIGAWIQAGAPQN
jgi:hypothetical protein